MRAGLAAVISISVVVWSLLLGLASPAHAEMGDISVGGVWVCRLTRGVPGQTLEQRTVEVERRITAVLSTTTYRQSGVAISVHAVGRHTVIAVDEQILLTVTPEDAMDTKVTPMELALQWAQRLAAGLNRALPDARFHVF